MTDDIRSRLEQAIREEDESSARRLRASHDRALPVEEKLEPVKQAAEELREQLSPMSSIEITINPDGVWISLLDRELRFSYDGESRTFVGEEGLRSWYDGEAYSYSYEWQTTEDCIDAMIRLCARYIRMARALGATAALT